MRFQSDGCAASALECCCNLGLRASRASLEELLRIDGEEAGFVEVQEQHRGGNAAQVGLGDDIRHRVARQLSRQSALVFESPAVSPSKVIRHVPTDVIERHARMTSPLRPQSARPHSERLSVFRQECPLTPPKSVTPPASMPPESDTFTPAQSHSTCTWTTKSVTTATKRVPVSCSQPDTITADEAADLRHVLEKIKQRDCSTASSTAQLFVPPPAFQHGATFRKETTSRRTSRDPYNPALRPTSARAASAGMRRRPEAPSHPLSPHPPHPPTRSLSVCVDMLKGPQKHTYSEQALTLRQAVWATTLRAAPWGK
jgi:hypothetical protein